MTTAGERKEQLRRSLKNYRSELSEETYKRQSEAILKKLRNLKEFKQARLVHCYISMNGRHEVDTHPLIKEMLNNGREVVVPRTNLDAGTLSHYTINTMEELVTNDWGVPEPEDGRSVDPASLDLVIVPMLGADEQGNRIGYGKGFYDRFLKEVNCPKIGLTYEQCIVDEGLPVEPFDVPLNRVVTEKRVIG